MPVKIEFQVVSCTGEDEDFRATELNYHGPTVRGWRSSVNCTFPQEIILQLKVLAILHQIQILTHQYLIPQKIEICTSSSRLDKPCDYHCDLFEYLGFITFSDNKATGFCSRELKSILIPSKKARYIKLRIHNNHVNVKNVYNQVGLVAVNILGDELYDNKTEESEVNNNSFHPAGAYSSTLTFNPNYLSPYDDLAFEMSVDEETAKIIKIVEGKMLRAVFEERLDYANALNITIENLRAAGEILGVYEQEKRKAIILEDFDKAKSKKFQIDNFRQKIYTTLHLDRLLGESDFAGGYDLNSNTEEKSILSNESSPIRNSPQRYETNGRTTTPSEIVKENHEMSPARTLRPPKRSQRSPPPLTHCKSQTFPDSYAFCHPFPTFATSSSNPHLYQYLKQTRPTINETHREPDRKLEASLENVRTPSSISDSLTGDDSPPPKSPEKTRSVKNRNVSLIPRRNIRNAPAGKGWKGSSPPDDWDGRTELKTSLRTKAANALKSSFEAYEDRMLPALRSFQGNEVVRECQLAFGQQRKSTLNEREKKQALLPIAVFGIEMIEKFYSKSFNDREEGLKQLQQELKRAVNVADENVEAKPFSYNKLARAAIFLLHRGLRDTVYSVYKLAAETVRLFFAEFVPQRVSLSEVARSVEKLLPELLTKSGDVTPRIHNMAAHTLLSMADCEEVRRLHIIPAHLSRPLTSSIHPRLALSRLEMVEQLILNHGISKDKKSGLTCRTLAEFGSSGLHHPAEAVRKVSERILIHVYKVNPRIVRKQLPPDDNVTRRNLLYRQLFQEFDFMDMERKLSEQTVEDSIPGFETNAPSRSPRQQPEVQKNKLKTAYGSGNENPVHQVTYKSSVSFNKDLVKAFLPQNTNKNRNYAERSPLRRPPPDQFKKGEQEAVQKKPVRYSEEGHAAVKFPSLTDSIKTTKARMLLDQKGSPRGNPTEPDLRKSQSVSSSLGKSLARKANRWDNANSGIPVPTFGTSRKLPMTSCKRSENKGQDKPPKLYKPKEESPQTRIPYKTIKLKMFYLDASAKPEIRIADALKKENENGNKKNKETEVEESIKFSESMLASIRENEFTMSSLFNEGDSKEEKLKTCIFCLSSNQWANEDSLNKHYLKECLMLTTCEYCMEVTEISGLTNHLLDDCKWKNIFQRCTNCQEVILRDLYSKHECTASGGKVHKLRCPFCHKDIGQGETSWRKHLTGNNTCPNHPRQK